MKICFLGNFMETYCSETHESKTLELMGHEVYRLQENVVCADYVVETANKCDLFIWVRTPGWFQGDAWDMIKRIKVPKIAYHLDLYIGLEREHEIAEQAFFHMDYFFQPDGDPESMKKFKEYGVNAIWMPPAVYGPECRIGTPRDEFKSAVAFVGNYNYAHKEWGDYRRKVLDMVAESFNFKIYPNEQSGVVMDQRLNDLIASVKILIGDSICIDFKHQNYWSNRLVEETGRGGFVIFPHIKGIETQFEIGKELVTYELGNLSDLYDKIAYYLAHEDERNVIRLAGHERAKRDHTFEKRFEKVFKIIGMK